MVINNDIGKIKSYMNNYNCSTKNLSNLVMKEAVSEIFLNKHLTH